MGQSYRYILFGSRWVPVGITWGRWVEEFNGQLRYWKVMARDNGDPRWLYDLEGGE